MNSEAVGCCGGGHDRLEIGAQQGTKILETLV